MQGRYLHQIAINNVYNIYEYYIISKKYLSVCLLRSCSFRIRKNLQ